MDSRLVYVVVLCATIVLNFQQVDADAVSWNYAAGSKEGPQNWANSFPDCGGVMQSPIDVDTDDVLYDKHLKLFNLYDYQITEGVEMKLENVGGHTAEVLMSGRPLYIQGGSLPAKYKLEQFHFHWGQNDRRGSEHSVNGNHFPMEIHLVHSQYRLANATVAAPHPFGLAVLAFFYKIGQYNPNYEPLLKYFGQITNATDEKVEIPTFRVIDLLPPLERFDYYRYQGSLTTPPCYETVIWTIFTEPIEISEEQLNYFRALYDDAKHKLVDDFRPVQDLNQRSVHTTKLSFKENNDGVTNGGDDGGKDDGGKDNGKKGNAGLVITPHIATFIIALFSLFLLSL